MSSPLNSALTILAQSVPSCPSSPSCPLAHCGIVKFKTAAQLVPELVTLALLPAAHVVVLQTVIVAASHWSPLSHFKSSIAIICVHVFMLLDLYRIYQSSTFISTLSHTAFTPVFVVQIHHIHASI